MTEEQINALRKTLTRLHRENLLKPEFHGMTVEQVLKEVLQRSGRTLQQKNKKPYFNQNQVEVQLKTGEIVWVTENKLKDMKKKGLIRS